MKSKDVKPNGFAGSLAWKERLWRRERLAALGFKMDEYYSKYLKTPHWKQFRLVRFREQREHLGYNCCQICDDRDRDLMLHHLTYERLGDELPTDVRIVCKECHETKLHRPGVGVDQKHAAYVPWRQIKE
jgi:hypothetical protein